MINLVSVSQALLVAEHLSFSRAAQVLGVRQSAVSRRVRALEDALGVSLFERESTGVRLTEAGRRFLERARPALSEIDHAVKAAANAGRGAEGVLRIGILSSVSGGFMRDVLGHYHCYNPAIAIELVEGSTPRFARVAVLRYPMGPHEFFESEPWLFSATAGQETLSRPQPVTEPRRASNSDLFRLAGRGLRERQGWRSDGLPEARGMDRTKLPWAFCCPKNTVTFGQR